MAYKDSDQIANDSNYALGDYSFRIERTSVPGSTNDKIEAICTQGGKNARKSIQIPSSQNLSGWYVDANDTEATVYAVVQIPIGGGKTSDLDISPLVQPVFMFNSWSAGNAQGTYRNTWTTDGDGIVAFRRNASGTAFFITGVSSEPGHYLNRTGGLIGHDEMTTTFDYQGKRVYYYPQNGDAEVNDGFSCGGYGGSYGKACWVALYGTPTGDEYETKEILVGRFAIDIKDAGGDGPGSDWYDPGDYDPNWEPEDPTHTLYVTVTGALSGRHNDPIEDPSYSYIPADKDTVKDYGCGGDGGHGGGGGAGASTVVIHKFATNQANSKEVTALARRHGYGSGGGKGGKGGDGCILVYY